MSVIRKACFLVVEDPDGERGRRKLSMKLTGEAISAFKTSFLFLSQPNVPMSYLSERLHSLTFSPTRTLGKEGGRWPRNEAALAGLAGRKSRLRLGQRERA